MMDDREEAIWQAIESGESPIPAEVTAAAPDAPSGDLRPLIQHFSACFDALARCDETGNQEWSGIWANRIAALARDHLPSGSGFDSGSTLNLDDSRSDRLVFETSFHHMNDSGMYDGWTEHRVIVIPCFVGIELKVTGRDKRSIRDYIGDTFAEMLGASVRLSDLDC